MSNFLRIANEEEGKRYYYKDTEEYIELRVEISKKKASQLLKFAPKKEDDLDGGLRFIEHAFAVLALGWSINDEKPTVEVYNELTAAAGAWIDKSIGQHLREILGAEAEEAEGKPEE